MLEPTYSSELVRRPPAGQQPPAPIYGLPLVDGLAGVQQDVQQWAQMLWGTILTVRVYVCSCTPLTLLHKHLSGRIRHFHTLITTKPKQLH